MSQVTYFKYVVIVSLLSHDWGDEYPVVVGWLHAVFLILVT